MITSKERLKKALNRESVDRPPCICPGGMMNMIVGDVMTMANITWPKAHVDAQMMATLAKTMVSQGGFENYGVPFCMTVEAEGLGGIVDLGKGLVEPHMTLYPYTTVKKWSELPSYDRDKGRQKVVIEAIKILKDGNDSVPIIGNVTGPLSVASSIIEPTEFYKELFKDKEDAHKFMTIVTDHIIQFAKDQIEAGADMITISDPSGTGEILGPKLFEEYAVFYINKIIDALSVYEGVQTIVHICGQLRPVFKSVKKLKGDALSFDAVVSIKKVKENVTDRAIMGNVSSYVLENGNPENVSKLANFCMDAGVHILSPACGLGTSTSMENIKTMVDTAKLRSKL